MRQQPTLNELKIRNNVWVIRQMTPLDFVCVPGGCPVTAWTVRKPKTMFDQVMGGSDSAESPEDQIKTITTVLNAGVVSLNKGKFDAKKYLSESTDMPEMLEIYGRILEMSFSVDRVIELELSQIQHIDAVAQRYGIQPVDVLFPKGGYTPLDAWIINSIVANEGYSHRNLLAQRHKLAWTISLQ